MIDYEVRKLLGYENYPRSTIIIHFKTQRFMKECKKRIREMLRDFGYKKITLSEDRRGVSKVYYLYGGVINIRVNDDLTFHFGEDKLFGCSAHICAGGVDCGTHYSRAEEIFKKMLTGVSSETEVCDYICSL